MARKRRKKSSDKTSLFILLGIITILTIMAGMFYGSISSDKNVVEVKPGSGEKKEIVSLLDESVEAQRILDSILLQKGNWQLIEKARGVKETNLEEANAVVKVNARTLAIGVPVSVALEDAGKWVKGKATAKLILKVPNFKLTKGKKQFKIKYTK